MLYERLKKALENTGTRVQEQNLENCPKEIEKVIIGHNYTDDNSDYDGERPDLGESFPIKDPVSPNALDPDSDIEEEESDTKELDSELNNEFTTTVTAPPEFYESTCTGSPVTLEDKEESMDRMEELEKDFPKEDTSGITSSHVNTFLEKYVDGNDVIQVLRMDLMRVLSDIQWIKESKNQHEQWALDFADALNEISTAI